MDWQFDHSHIASWAQFSGDFNPIHFDVERARQAGSDAIIVHGMLPLLHVKQAIARRHVHATTPDRWLNIKCRLKTPLQRGVNYAFSVRDAGTTGKFSIHDSAKNCELIQGNFSVMTPTESAECTETISIVESEISEKLTQFSQLFPTISELWIAVDSLVFSRFLGSGIGYRLAKENNMSADAKSQEELMNLALTIQTFHSVQIAPEFAQKDIRDRADITSIDVRMGKPITIKNGDSELFGTNQLNIYINNRFAMQSEIGLMLKQN